MDGESASHGRAVLALGGDGVDLLGQREAGKDFAELEDGGGAAEDEIDGAVDGGVEIELAFGVGVESVLEGDEAASVEDGAVGVVADGDGLSFPAEGGVPEGDSGGDESVSVHGCNCR